MAQRITERFAFSGGTVDRSGKYPVIRGVSLCGLESANRRRYRPAAFGTPDQRRYTGRSVFVNHGKDRESRRYEDKLGWVEEEGRDDKGRPVGTIGVNPKHPLAEAFLFDAEHRPDDIGMSHVAQCETVKGADGWDEVTDVVHVESVDVVVGPATTKGLYRAEQKGQAMTVKEYLQKLAPRLLVNQLIVGNKLLKEYGDAEMMGDAPAVDAAETEGGDGVTAAVKAAAAAEIDECLASSSDPAAVKRCLQRLKKILGLHGELSGEEEEPEEEEDDGEEEMPKESKKPALKTVLAECAKAGFQPKPHDLAALTEMRDADDRKSFVEGRLAETKTAERVTSTGRKPGAGSAGATKPAEKVEEQRLIPKW